VIKIDYISINKILIKEIRTFPSKKYIFEKTKIAEFISLPFMAFSIF